MTVRELVEKNRSIRIFKPSPAPTRAQLESWVDVARISASGGNLQPLAYYLSADEATNDKVFATLRWAGYLTDWAGPTAGERPTGYVVLLRDNDVTNNFIVDHGIASEIIRMAAFEEGFGSCLIGSVDRPKLREALGISNRYELLVVLALGAPGERVVLETASGGNIRYWRDGHGALHVPKRALRDILVN